MLSSMFKKDWHSNLLFFLDAVTLCPCGASIKKLLKWIN